MKQEKLGKFAQFSMDSKAYRNNLKDHERACLT